MHTHRNINACTHTHTHACVHALTYSIDKMPTTVQVSCCKELNSLHLSVPWGRPEVPGSGFRSTHNTERKWQGGFGTLLSSRAQLFRDTLHCDQCLSPSPSHRYWWGRSYGWRSRNLPLSLANTLPTKPQEPSLGEEESPERKFKRLRRKTGIGKGTRVAIVRV